MSERLFKVLKTDGTVYHHKGTFAWSLPHDGQPGKWMPPVVGELVPCQNGYHLCRESDLVRWLGPAIFEPECRGDRVDAADKVVVREARLIRLLDTWNKRTARLFACDCAEHVLCLFERESPADCRPRQAIETARRHANGEVTGAELDAARDAGAARDAEYQWQTQRLMSYLYPLIGPRPVREPEEDR